MDIEFTFMEIAKHGMDILTSGFVELVAPEPLLVHSNGLAHAGSNGRNGISVRNRPTEEFLRRCAWEIGEKRPTESYTPATSHVGLAVVTPAQGFAHWRVLPVWVEHTARQKGDAWHRCRFVLRLYDVSFIEFNGLNAHQMRDLDLPGLSGDFFFKLPRPGTWQLAEVGFLLRSGEFLAAARSQAVSFPPDAASGRGSHAAILVDANGRIEEIGNLWDQDRILRERRQPRLRKPLRSAAFAFASPGSGQQDSLATFVSELATGQCAQGHEAHVFVPATEHFRAYQQVRGVHYHPLDVCLNGSPLEKAKCFSAAAEARLNEFPPFDMIHLHEWMTGVGAAAGDAVVVRSLSSIESTRRGDRPATEFSLAIEEVEREAVRSADCILTPPWLRDKCVQSLAVEDSRVRSFPMEGRLANQWEEPLDVGHVKMSIGFGPLDRLVLFVGPVEHAAGVDLLLEAVPVLLQRSPNLRVAFVGEGALRGQLQHRAQQIGVAHAVRMLGHVEGTTLTRLLRAAEVVTLPSRYRVPFDDGVVDLARRAGRPVVTTHAGPAHLVRHEETGIITYDNPGSMVWAMDRILGDPAHADRMGQNGRRHENSSIQWSDVARCYLELCACQFPQLTELTW